MKNHSKATAVPYFDFKRAPRNIQKSWARNVKKVLDSGYFINGPRNAEFASKFCDYIGTEYLVGVGNGFDALTIAIKSLALPPGSKIAVPSHTFFASWLSIHHSGSTPVPVDVDLNGQLSIELLKTVISEIDAVMVVHMHGISTNMSELEAVCKSYKIPLIEDCAQSHGGDWDGKKLGSFGTVSAFSFYPTKNLGAIGDAGAVVTSNQEIYERAKAFSNYGVSTSDKYNHLSLGVNSRLDELQAGILIENLKHLDEWNARRREVSNYYLSELPNLREQPILNQKNHVWHHFSVMFKNRDKSQEFFKERGIGTEIHYPYSCQKLFNSLVSNKFRVEDKSPNSDSIAEHILSLPNNQWMSDGEIEYVAENLKSGLARSLIFLEE